MKSSTERYVAVLAGRPANVGPRGGLVMAYTMAVYRANQETVTPPLALDWERTRYLQQNLVMEAEQVLESQGWRVAGDWSCLAQEQHWFAGDHGSWAAPVVPITDHIRRAGAFMAGQDLAGKDLTAVVLAGAVLTGADLRGANLTRVDLSRADLTQARLTGAVLHSTNLANANLARADLTETDLSEAKLDGANLVDADLSNASIRGPNAAMSGVRMMRAKLVGARLGTAINVDLTGADLSYADLHGAWLSDTCLRDATLVGANLYRARLLGVDLTGATLPELDAMVNVTWNDGTTWDPSDKPEIVKRSTNPEPLIVTTPPETRQPEGPFKSFRRPKHVESQRIVRWHQSVLNPLPQTEFERAVIEYFGQLLIRRRQAGASGDELFWVTTEQLTAGVSELMGRIVPKIAVESFLSSNASPRERPSLSTLFHVGRDGRYRINSGANWSGQSVSHLLRYGSR